MALVQKWISPAEAMDMMFDDPAGPTEGFGFALLRQRAKGRINCIADLTRAKLQPQNPIEGEGERWPITASDCRLVLAPGVADVTRIEHFCDDYDAIACPRQKLLAVVLTMKFDHDSMQHDMMSMATAYAEINLSRARRLSSLIVLHVPGLELSARQPHVHIVVLARVHRAVGFQQVHADLLGDDAHQRFHEEWLAFRTAWEKTLWDAT